MFNRKGIIETVSCDIGRALLQEVAPEELNQFETVQRRAFPRTLKDVTFGKTTDLVEALVQFVRAVAEVLSTKGDMIYQASARSGALATLEREIKVVLDRLEELQQREQRKGQMGRLTGALPGILEQKLDDIIPVISPVFSVSERQRQILRRCVLRIIHPDGGASTGFLVCSRGHVLTAAHVVQGAEWWRVAFRYGRDPSAEFEGRARVIHIDDQPGHRNNIVRDLAILELTSDFWEQYHSQREQRKEIWEYDLQPPLFSMYWDAGDPVFCLGYQHYGTAVEPCGVGARIHPWNPTALIRVQKNREEFEFQHCLWLVPLPEVPFSFGISGGPVLRLEDGEGGKVIGVVTATEFSAWRRYEENGRVVWRAIPPGSGFAVLLSDVFESWPEFGKCCLAEQESQGGAACQK